VNSSRAGTVGDRLHDDAESCIVMPREGRHGGSLGLRGKPSAEYLRRLIRLSRYATYDPWASSRDSQSASSIANAKRTDVRALDESGGVADGGHSLAGIAEMSFDDQLDPADKIVGAATSVSLPSLTSAARKAVTSSSAMRTIS
jgi:hypothetical protein